jgi:hypothetical protein
MKINKSSLKAYLLITILVVAAILRSRQINQPFIDGFSWREASTAMMAENFYRISWNIFYPEVNWSGPGPNYQGREFQTITYITALLYVVIGPHDWVGRSVAIAFGLWGIFALYQLVRLVWDEKHALISAAVMAVLPGSIFVERSFVPDPAMVSLITTALWMLVAYLQKEHLKYLLLAALFGTWGSLTKITGLIAGIPAIYVTFTILRSKKKQRPRQITILIIAMILTLIPVIGYYLWAKYLAMSYPPYHFAGDGFWIWDGPQEWWKQKFFLPQIVQYLRGWLWTTPGLALVLLGLFCLPPVVQDDKKSAPYPLFVHESGQIRWLFHWWFAGFIFFFLVGAHELYANAWNLHIVNPIAATLAGRAIIVIATLTTRLANLISIIIPQNLQLRVPGVIILLLLLILIIFGQKALRYMYEPPAWYADQSYSLGVALHQISQPDDLVVTLAHALGDPVAIYYSQRRGWVFTLGEGPDYPERKVDDTALPKDDSISIQKIESLRKKGAIWLGIVGIHQNRINKDHPLLLKYLKENCEIRQINPDWAIYHFLPPNNHFYKEETSSRN